MNWGGVAEFLAMGGYAGFVWGSFGVTAACMALEIVLLAKRRRAALRALPGSATRTQ
ncbi:MAG: heme exporter protein CcmD [Betaproteobacteria bacterium]|nr:heme exporter protein CcmD [Betaproteobacteria bacterium]